MRAGEVFGRSLCDIGHPGGGYRDAGFEEAAARAEGVVIAGDQNHAAGSAFEQLRGEHGVIVRTGGAGFRADAIGRDAVEDEEITHTGGGVFAGNDDLFVGLLAIVDERHEAAPVGADAHNAGVRIGTAEDDERIAAGRVPRAGELGSVPVHEGRKDDQQKEKASHGEESDSRAKHVSRLFQLTQ